MASAIGALEEWRVRAFGGLPLVTRGAVDIFRWSWALDSRASARELGYATTPLAEGLERTLAAAHA